MSRSRRKTLIFGITTCRSEREDKRIWHGRLRSRERTTLQSTAPDTLEGHAPTSEKEVSNPWSMGKDGRTYWPKSRQLRRAERDAMRLGRTPEERAALKQRLLKKWMGK